MEPVVIARGRNRSGRCVCPFVVRPINGSGRTALMLTLAAGIGLAAARAEAPVPPPAEPPGSPGSLSKGRALRETRQVSRRPAARPGLARSALVVVSATAQPRVRVVTASTPVPAPESTPPAAAPRFRIRDESGHCVVARLHGQFGDQTALIQPDGQLGYSSRLVPTDEPFVPLTAATLRARLQKGPFAEYQVLTTPHYLIFYQSTPGFAQNSARLLEDLYRGLSDWCRKHELPVHEAEFPLVAVIFANEHDFRAYKPVDPEVQAYYEICPNRILFYQQSDGDRDRLEPKLTALRKPQTVAHEGAHQVLSNIGVQPRLSSWPLWLAEGLAEYCATPALTKKGIAWDRVGTINALHMATLRELDDPLANQVDGSYAAAGPVRGESHRTRAESLILTTRFTPTNYAQAWALTHYLAQKRGPDDELVFVEFLKSMSRMPPLQPRTPEQHLAEFRKVFGENLVRVLDKRVNDYLGRLIKRQKGSYDPLPYYAVIFQQPLGGGLVRRAAMVSQSPQVIEEWVQERISPQGGPHHWQAIPYLLRGQAEFCARQWTRGF